MWFFVIAFPTVVGGLPPPGRGLRGFPVGARKRVWIIGGTSVSVGVKGCLSPYASLLQPVFQLMTTETRPQKHGSADGKQTNGPMGTDHLCTGLEVNKSWKSFSGGNCCVGVYQKIFCFCTRAPLCKTLKPWNSWISVFFHSVCVLSVLILSSSCVSQVNNGAARRAREIVPV